jgi:hypothetical protein
LNSNNKATKAVQRTREKRPVRARSRELQLAERQAETRRGHAAIRSLQRADAQRRERRPRTAPFSRAVTRAVEMRFATSLLGLDVDGKSNVHVWMICLYSHENKEKRFYSI